MTSSFGIRQFCYSEYMNRSFLLGEVSVASGTRVINSFVFHEVMACDLLQLHLALHFLDVGLVPHAAKVVIELLIATTEEN